MKSCYQKEIVMIPKIIWQTYKTSTPPLIFLDSVHTWLIKNPEYKWYYFDDDKCQQFIRDHFNDEFYKMYTSLPIGVMKADVWRVAVVYTYGGVYADLDTTCIKPITDWVKDKDLVVGVETEHGSINNYVFAASPKHPALYTVLEEFLNIYNSPGYLYKGSPTPVQDFGANAWSHGILKHFNLVGKMTLGAEYYNQNLKVLEENALFYSFESHTFSFNQIETTAVHHRSGSVFYLSEYDSWRVDQQKLFGMMINE